MMVAYLTTRHVDRIWCKYWQSNRNWFNSLLLITKNRLSNRNFLNSLSLKTKKHMSDKLFFNLVNFLSLFRLKIVLFVIFFTFKCNLLLLSIPTPFISTFIHVLVHPCSFSWPSSWGVCMDTTRHWVTCGSKSGVRGFFFLFLFQIVLSQVFILKFI